MIHESDGAVDQWSMRLLFFRCCRIRHDQKYGESDSCPYCGSKEYYIIEEYLEGDADAA